jgi:hypothetical protein
MKNKDLGWYNLIFSVTADRNAARQFMNTVGIQFVFYSRTDDYYGFIAKMSAKHMLTIQILAPEIEHEIITLLDAMKILADYSVTEDEYTTANLTRMASFL